MARLFFSSNPGRSGSKFLSTVLARDAEIASFHEDWPNLSEELITPAEKAEIIASTVELTGKNYADTTHMFIRTFAEAIFSRFQEAQVSVICLRRDPLEAITSMLQLGWFSSHSRAWEKWFGLEQPYLLEGVRYPRNLQDPLGRAVGHLLWTFDREVFFKKRFGHVNWVTAWLPNLNSTEGRNKLEEQLQLDFRLPTVPLGASELNNRLSKKAKIRATPPDSGEIGLRLEQILGQYASHETAQLFAEEFNIPMKRGAPIGGRPCPDKAIGTPEFVDVPTVKGHIKHIIPLLDRDAPKQLVGTQRRAIETIFQASRSSDPNLSIELVGIRPRGRALADKDFLESTDLVVEDWTPKEFRASGTPHNHTEDIFKAARGADLFVYSNIDICLQKNFYSWIWAQKLRGLRSFSITRRTVPHVLALDFGEANGHLGLPHPGDDCFVFQPGLLSNHSYSATRIGLPLTGRLVSINLLLNNPLHKKFRNEMLTFHFGDDRDWFESASSAENLRHFKLALSELKKTWGRANVNFAHKVARSEYGDLWNLALHSTDSKNSPEFIALMSGSPRGLKQFLKKNKEKVEQKLGKKFPTLYFMRTIHTHFHWNGINAFLSWFRK